MLVRSEQQHTSTPNRATFALRMTEGYAEMCELMNYFQLAQLRKTLRAIVTHEIMNYDDPESEREVEYAEN